MQGAPAADRPNPPAWHEPVDLGAHPTRWPLEVGSSALWNLGRGSIALPLGIVVACSLGVIRAGSGDVGLIAGIFLSLVLIAQGIGGFVVAARRFPSDALISRSGFAVEGSGSAFAIRLSDLDPARCAVVSEQVQDRSVIRALGRFLYGAGAPLLARFAMIGIRLPDAQRLFGKPVQTIQRLRLVLRSGAERDVADAETRDDQASLAALLDTIRALDEKQEQPPVAGAVEILRCSACGAPVTPTAQAQAECVCCHARVTVPREIAERVAAAETVTRDAARAERVVAKVLRQPGAARAKRWLVFALAFGLASWAATVVLIAWSWHAERLDRAGASLLIAAPLAVILAVSASVRARLVDRQALRALTLRFAARAPLEPGAPPRCRVCGAPLASPARRVIAHCVYCDAENVLGLALRRQGRAVTGMLDTLDDALARRRRARVAWSLLSALGVLLLPLGAVAFAAGAHRSPESALRESCHAGRLAACESLERAVRAGRFKGWSKPALTGVQARACRLGAVDDCRRAARATRFGAERVALERRACELEDGHACAELGYAERHALGVPRNDAAARKHYERGCALKSGWACNNLGAMLDQAPESRARNGAHILQLYISACRLDYALGCANLADAYAAGRFTRRDAAQALEIRERACRLEARYCAPLVKSYGAGWAARKDVAALIDDERRCEQNDAAACGAISNANLDGKLLPLDIEGAAVYRVRACRLGDKAFCSKAGARKTGKNAQ